MKKVNPRKKIAKAIRRIRTLTKTDPQIALRQISKVERKFGETVRDNLKLLKARCYFQIGEFEKARDIAQEEYSRLKDRPSRLFFAQILTVLDRLDEAEALIKNLAGYNNDAFALSILIQILYRKGDYKNAEITARKRLLIRRNEFSYCKLAEALRKQKRYKEALQNIRKISFNERSIDMLLCQAYCHMNLNQFQEAFKCFLAADNMIESSRKVFPIESVRFSAGLLFLFQQYIEHYYSKDDWEEVREERWYEIIIKAAKDILSIDHKKLRKNQERDYYSACNIIKKRNIK